MPLYDYKCEKCDEIVEILQSFSDRPPVCEECGEEMVRLPNTFAVKMKNPWVTKMERKWGKQGDPYRDEEGKPRPGTKQDTIPHIPGPKTLRKRRAMVKELKDAARRKDINLPGDFIPGGRRK